LRDQFTGAAETENNQTQIAGRRRCHYWAVFLLVRNA